jgi:hypothetical protein
MAGPDAGSDDQFLDVADAVRSALMQRPGKSPPDFRLGHHAELRFACRGAISRNSRTRLRPGEAHRMNTVTAGKKDRLSAVQHGQDQRLIC